MKKTRSVLPKKRQEVLQRRSRQKEPQHISTEKRSRSATVIKKRLAPPALATLIGVVNRVPAGLPWLRDLRTMAEGNLIDLDHLVWNQVATFPQSLRVLIPSLPEKDDRLGYLQWIRGGEREGQRSRARLYYCYDYAVQGKIALDAIADSPGESIGPFRLESHLDVDSEGKLTIHPHPILDALEGVERKRIRRCPACAKIYWAERIDQPACSKKCNNNRRSRLFRGTLKA